MHRFIILDTNGKSYTYEGYNYTNSLRRHIEENSNKIVDQNLYLYLNKEDDTSIEMFKDLFNTDIESITVIKDIEADSPEEEVFKGYTLMRIENMNMSKNDNDTYMIIFEK